MLCKLILIWVVSCRICLWDVSQQAILCGPSFLVSCCLQLGASRLWLLYHVCQASKSTQLQLVLVTACSYWNSSVPHDCMLQHHSWPTKSLTLQCAFLIVIRIIITMIIIIVIIIIRIIIIQRFPAHDVLGTCRASLVSPAAWLVHPCKALLIWLSDQAHLTNTIQADCFSQSNRCGLSLDFCMLCYAWNIFVWFAGPLPRTRGRNSCKKPCRRRPSYRLQPISCRRR